MPIENELEIYRKSLAEIEQNIERLQADYDAIPRKEAINGISPAFTKAQQISDMLYEQRIRRLDVLGWIEFFEKELAKDEMQNSNAPTT